jgi:predicted porin
VTISGALNLWYESAAATGATAGAALDAKSRDRIIDGAGSNIRFTVVEDIGGGMQAFGQVESAVFNNADTRNNAAATGAVTGGWGNRNSGVGLRSSAWGEILMGIWDVHYHEHYAADSHIIRGTSNSNSLGLLNTFGTSALPAIGARYGNVIRYQSPNWSGFNVRVVYARPTDTIPPNTPGVVGDDKKNRVWNFAPSYSAGPIFVGYSHLRDKDIVATAGVTTGALAGAGIGASTFDVRSDRFMGSYTLPMGFKVGFIYDRSKLTANTAGGSGDVKRDVWVLPLAYTTGAHQVHFNYAKAKSWKGSGVDGLTVTSGGTTYSAGSNSGARMISLGYQYDLSKRTNLHLTYAQIKNEALAQYDFFSASVGTGATQFGADPRVYSIGLRHAF